MEVKIEKSWKEALAPEFEADYFAALTDFVKKEYKSNTVYPPAKFIFRAFELTPFDKVRVVILGQDPYHGPGQAHGLSFSVPAGINPPPSLQNIYKELEADLGMASLTPDVGIPKHRVLEAMSGNLEKWAEQGVLLLNATLTVRAHLAGSHQKKGWEEFTDAVIKVLSDKKENIVFILWGNYAKEKGKTIDPTKHHIITSPHPSPFSAYSGFFGSRPFSKTNEYLKKNNLEPIEW